MLSRLLRGDVKLHDQFFYQFSIFPQPLKVKLLSHFCCVKFILLLLQLSGWAALQQQQLYSHVPPLEEAVLQMKHWGVSVLSESSADYSNNTFQIIHINERHFTIQGSLPLCISSPRPLPSCSSGFLRSSLLLQRGGLITLPHILHLSCLPSSLGLFHPLFPSSLCIWCWPYTRLTTRNYSQYLQHLS